MLLKFHQGDGHAPEAKQHESQRSRKVLPSGEVPRVNLKGLRAWSHENEKRERLQPNVKRWTVLSKIKRRECD